MASQSGQALHLTARRKLDSVHLLRLILAKLKHLDLTGKIRFASAVMKTHGGYADVFLGFAALERHGTPEEIKVAIKRLRIHIQGDADFAKSLSKEIRVWSGLEHKNVLAFLGYALEGEDYPLLISEWMENGTAKSFVNMNPDCDITYMILGIAEGLAYLHSKGVIHADMKADNVLVSADGQPRICDFGISSILATSTTFGATSSHNYGTRGSLRWMAIEFFKSMDVPVLHSEKTDVWAFGMTAYELISKQLPYAHIKLDPQVLLAIIQGILPPRPDLVDQPGNMPQLMVWGLCCSCWRKDSDMRPDMHDIVGAMNIVHNFASGEYADNVSEETATYTRYFETYPNVHVADEDNEGQGGSALQSPVEYPYANQQPDQPSAAVDSSEDFAITLQMLSAGPVVEPSDDYDVRSSPSNNSPYGWNAGVPWRVRFESPPGSPVADSFAGTSLVPTPQMRSVDIDIPEDDDVILKEGYLAEVTDDPVFRLYTTRYYVLKSSSLRYYRRRDGELLGTISVIGAQLPDEAGRRRGYQSALLLITRRKMGLLEEASLRILYAEDANQCKDWVSAIQQMAGDASSSANGNEMPYKFPSSPSVDGFATQAPEARASASTMSVDAFQKQKQEGKSARKNSLLQNSRAGLVSMFRRFTS